MVSFSDPEKLAKIFDDENRHQWQNTDFILSALNIKENEVICDVGAGTGYFCQQILDKTLASMVYAIDLEPNMVFYLKNRFSLEPKVRPLSCQADDPQIPQDADVIFIANCYRFIQDRQRFLANLKQQIQRKARVFIVDFKGAASRVSPEQALSDVIHSGFEVLSFDRNSCPDHFICSFRLSERAVDQ
ncbi:class I SAM-dependent methyltransferase [Vibrio tritonius]|uniref:class I SAM-dependent methyltransferase n=1 Tax=Vibrio tritonius TaxID=1435069 RepID=UPI00315DB49D